MCGSPISGPLLILFFPLGVGILAVSRVINLVHSIDVSIRKNNEKIESGVSHISKDLKEKILFRKQLIAESKLEGKIKADTTQDPQVARLHVQRAVVRLAAMKYEGALEDIKLALHLDESLDATYVWNFVYGVALYHCGDYLESAHAFKKGIELKEAMTGSGNCDKKSVELEKNILDINFEMKHSHEKVKEQFTEFSENTKTYFNNFKSLLKGEKVDLAAQKEEKTTVSLISLEELNYRAGCSYYFAACYHDAIKNFETAAQYGKDSPNLRHYIYNKGLCYFYNHELDEALEAFSQAMKLEENAETAQMISQTYGRKGELELKQEYLKKATELDPKTKLITAFNYRLLNEDCTKLVFSYLPTYTRVNISSTNKYWRELLMRSVLDDPIFEMSIRNLVNNLANQKKKLEMRSLREKIFLPVQEAKTTMNFMEDVLKSSFFKYYIEKKEKRVIIPIIYENYYKSFYANEICFPFMKDLVYVDMNAQTYANCFDILSGISPDLKDLVLRDDETACFEYSIPSSFVKFPNLKALTIAYSFTDYFMSCYRDYGGFSFPPSLEKFYYNPDSCPEFMEIFSQFPTIEFIPLTNIETFYETV
ncbi:predicted protein [Naegleria gruberi]|uniref:Predicted protein n=1 Tax=Naegleria gruberi TaxID=5762 RepID=D2VGZ3_NAEGR|nr:uncharacterized protein NAEGRDRAFT_79953 [Naegleria gruberi]EFC43891.1 predicted protein [Naegleria gruberi]|eukprot:XP_002676635.1 predicted protein [Naegleria gruberi strain NEG-M]